MLPWCTKFQEASPTKVNIMRKRDFMRFQFKEDVSRIENMFKDPEFGIKLYCIRDNCLFMMRNKNTLKKLFLQHWSLGMAK